MLKSMTAFAREQVQHAAGVVSWEIRTVNHRYLDVNFRLPEIFRELEPVLREEVAKVLRRGKVDCALRYQPGSHVHYDIAVNESLVEKLQAALSQLSKTFEDAAATDLVDILRWPGVVQTIEADNSAIQKVVLQSFGKTMKSIDQTRKREGKQLKLFIEQRLEQIKEELKTVQKHLPGILKEQQNRLSLRFKEAKIELDASRVEQEMVMLAQKVDVSEELDRIQIHLKEVQRVLNAKEAVGRRLDFLMQELNREANTLGSKSIHQVTTYASVELKVLIEQMREQVQNIE